MLLLFTQAVSLTHGDDFVTYRSVREISDVHSRFLQNEIDTMEKVFSFTVRSGNMVKSLPLEQEKFWQKKMRFSQMDESSKKYIFGPRHVYVNKFHFMLFK